MRHANERRVHLDKALEFRRELHTSRQQLAAEQYKHVDMARELAEHNGAEGDLEADYQAAIERYEADLDELQIRLEEQNEVVAEAIERQEENEARAEAAELEVDELKSQLADYQQALDVQQTRAIQYNQAIAALNRAKELCHLPDLTADSKNRGQGMLLNMMCGRRLSAISLCLAVTFAPLFNAQADEPEVIPGDSPVAVSEQGEALPQAQATAIMAGIQPLPELNQLQLLYAARDMQPMWENRDAVKAFQQQLAEVAIAGFQPQFNKWVELLTDPGVNGMARDVVLSDAMMGYLHFIANIPVKGTRWLYSSKPYALATPPLSVINQWQLALDKGQLPTFVAGLAPQHPQYAAMHESLLALLSDTKPWPQLTGKATLRPGQWSNDVPALREILQRTGIAN